MQEFLIRFICGALLVPFGYILLVCILAEMSLGRPKIKDGILQVRKNSFVLKYIYKNNIGNKLDQMKYPKDICQLFWGIYWGFFYFIFGFIIGVVIILIALFFGFAPNCKEGTPFEPYQTYKKTNKETGEVLRTKKFIAPWKFVAGFLIWYPFAFYFDKTFERISYSITEIIFPAIIGTLCVFVFIKILRLFSRIKNPIRLTAVGEFLKSKNRKVCISVDLVD